MHYVIGDIQGCLPSLEKLLVKISFNPQHDQLIIAGDLVNRGSDSLGTLRLLRSFGDSCTNVLGNHDVHLLATAYGRRKANYTKDNFHNILEAPDKIELLEWLRHKPFLLDYPEFDVLIVHAGIPHIWTHETAVDRAAEISQALIATPSAYLSTIYTNKHYKLSHSMNVGERWASITNYFTRMRYINKKGRMDFDHKEHPDVEQLTNYQPWFSFKNKGISAKILFGHWSTIMGDNLGYEQVIPLDTGCLWGNKLTAYCLETGKFYAQKKVEP